MSNWNVSWISLGSSNKVFPHFDKLLSIKVLDKTICITKVSDAFLSKNKQNNFKNEKEALLKLWWLQKHFVSKL